MKLVKAILKHIFTLPQIVVHRMRGIDTPYSQMVTFFRYFPFGKINKNKTVEIDYRKTAVKFYYGDLYPMAAGEFAAHDYDLLPVEGADVIDIGAAVGDTAVIFSLRGAKNVIGYELNKRFFEIAKINISLNKIEDKVSLNYCGIAAKKISKNDEILGALISGEDRNFVEEADFKTFDEITIAQNKSENLVLKIDVDGYEYEILRSASKNLINKYKYIAMEYHFGKQDLISILEESGFEVTTKHITNVMIDYHPSTYKSMEIGLIYAKRIKNLN